MYTCRFVTQLHSLHLQDEQGTQRYLLWLEINQAYVSPLKENCVCKWKWSPCTLHLILLVPNEEKYIDIFKILGRNTHLLLLSILSCQIVKVHFHYSLDYSCLFLRNFKKVCKRHVLKTSDTRKEIVSPLQEVIKVKQNCFLNAF